MTGICWLLIGAGVGTFYVVVLWHSVSSLRPAQPQFGTAQLSPERSRAGLLLLWRGVLMRCLSVAGVLTLAIRSGFWPFLLAWLGFVLTRVFLVKVISLRLA